MVTLRYQKNMELVLVTFSDNLFAENHMWIFSNSALITLISLFKSLSQQRLFVSSANKINLNILETLQMSLMYIINNFGPKIEPCGTPHDTFSVSEL